MQELQYPFDAAWILKNRKKIKKALLADGTTRFESGLRYWAVPQPTTLSPFWSCFC